MRCEIQGSTHASAIEAIDATIAETSGFGADDLPVVADALETALDDLGAGKAPSVLPLISRPVQRFSRELRESCRAVQLTPTARGATRDLHCHVASSQLFGLKRWAAEC